MPWTKIYPDKSEFEKACKEAGKKLRGITYQDAIREALMQSMERDSRIFVMGEGVDDPGGIFGTTLGLKEKFGSKRVFDTPIAENAMTGVALGAAITGMRPVLVHMRMDFLPLSMDQILNHASKWKYMFGGRVTVPLTIRSIIGRGWGSASQHSQSLQGLFMHIPGLKIVMPVTPYEAKGLLIASIEDENPVLFIEHRWLYAHVGYVPKKPYSLPLGQGIVKRQGKDITFIGISYMVFEGMKAAEKLKEQNIDMEIIDLRTIKPFDKNIILDSIKKTGRLIIADTGCVTCGATAELSAWAAQEGFHYLKAPIERVGLPEAPTPSSPVLEEAYYPGVAEIVSAAGKIIRCHPYP
jgi:pyruvate dehydrogenase E1 component beta subunit